MSQQIMKIRPLILLLLAAIFTNATKFPLIQVKKSTPKIDFVNNTNGLGNNNYVALAFTSPAVLLKQSKHRQRSGFNLKLTKNEAIENRITDTSERFQSKLSTTQDFVVGSTLLAFGKSKFHYVVITFRRFYVFQCQTHEA